MNSLVDWLLNKVNLIEETEEGDGDKEPVGTERFNRSRGAKTKRERIYCKRIKGTDDARQVIEEYKKESICLVLFDIDESKQLEVISYLMGAIYALDGVMEAVSKDVYIITSQYFRKE